MTKVDAKALAMPTYLGALGMTGMTAYFGLLDVGKPKAGDTVVVSGAAGAVGTVVGQIAKIKGCRVVGIAGGEAKTRMLVEDLGFDAAIDYKSEDVRKALQRHCPKGLDVYFDNVGVPILDAALANLARGARIVICGAISQYNSTEGIKGPSNYLALLVARAIDDRHGGVRLRRPLWRSAARNGRLDQRGPLEAARDGGRRASRPFPRR